MTPTQLIGADLVSAENNRNSQIENKTINQKVAHSRTLVCVVSPLFIEHSQNVSHSTKTGKIKSMFNINAT